MPPAPSRRASASTSSRSSAAAAGTRAPRRAGTSARRRSRPTPGRSRERSPRTASASSDVGQRLARRRDARRRSHRLDELARRPRRRRRAARGTRSATASSTWRKLGSPCRGSGGKYVPPKNGSPVGREEDGHRPAAVPGQRDDRVHVDRVEVGPLLAVDLDVDEVLVHQRRRLLVLERLVLHHVAPVAGGVADREQDRPVLVARAARAPPRPTGTSRPGCPRAGGGTGWSRRRGGSCCAFLRRVGGRTRSTPRATATRSRARGQAARSRHRTLAAHVAGRRTVRGPDGVTVIRPSATRARRARRGAGGADLLGGRHEAGRCCSPAARSSAATCRPECPCAFSDEKKRRSMRPP